jgi:hypothetical protein
MTSDSKSVISQGYKNLVFFKKHPWYSIIFPFMKETRIQEDIDLYEKNFGMHQDIIDEDKQMTQFGVSLQHYALTWFMNFTENQNRSKS